jgi:pre-rRNA-processing protein TSR2
MSLFSTLVPIIRSVFSRWTALQLAVAHSMGGSESEAKYEAFIEAFGQYLARNVRPSLSVSAIEQDIQEYLDEILDEEFNTVLDDGSSHELAQLFIRYIELIQQGKLADVQQELQVQNTTTPAIQMSVRNENEDDSSSSSSDDDGENNNNNRDDNEMREEQSINESKSQAMDVDEDGWVTVRRRGGGKK